MVRVVAVEEDAIAGTKEGEELHNNILLRTKATTLGRVITLVHNLVKKCSCLKRHGTC